MQLNSGSLQSASNASPAAPATVMADFDRLSSDFRAFLGDCEKLLTSAQTLSGEGAAVARAEFGRRMADARVKLDALRTTATHRAARARHVTEEYVSREPWKAIAIAAAMGAIVGLLLSRR
jgi:ElaB/YqjD/DUF883 family membrane-anchored ribosome-binding protein